MALISDEYLKLGIVGRRKKEEGRRKKEEDIYSKLFSYPYLTFN
ncbi:MULTISPECIES: hypothetical protein [Microcoleaceae]|nr:hypothetical protein [Lyngbya sp. CCAP 1446/10]